MKKYSIRSGREARQSSRSKSRERSRGRSTSKGRKGAAKEVNRELRSRSRGRPASKEESPPAKPVTRLSSTKSRSPAKPLVNSAMAPVVVIKNLSHDSTNDGRLSQLHKEEITRNSFTRFDDAASEAVVTLRKSNRMLISSEGRKLRDEVEEEVSTILREASMSRGGSTSGGGSLSRGGSLTREQSVEGSVRLKERPDFKLYDVLLEEESYFGSWPITFLLILLVPAFPLLLQLSCVKGRCSMKDLSVPLAWHKYLDPEAGLLYTGFLAFQLVLSSLPLGFATPDSKYASWAFNYRSNGLVSLLITESGVFWLWWYNYYPVTTVIDRSVGLVVTAELVALVLSMLLALFAPRTLASSGSRICDFWAGRTLHPRIATLDLKTAVVRASVILAILYNCLLVLKEYEAKGRVGEALAVCVCLQLSYLLDFVFFEATHLSSFRVRHEALGYLTTIGPAIFPFIITIIPKYLYYNSVNCNRYVLAGVSLLHILGYILFHWSNAQKAELKRSSSINHFSGIETMDGRKLVMTGAWGWVRHPNHLGVLLMTLSWTLLSLSGPGHWAPWLVLIATLVYLAHRARCQDATSRLTYRSVWSRYTLRVPYDLVPKIF